MHLLQDVYMNAYAIEIYLATRKEKKHLPKMHMLYLKVYFVH